MKKIIMLASAIALCASASFATSTESQTATVESTYSQVSVPTGAFFNGNNFVYVQSSFIRIVIGGQITYEGSYQTEIDPWGNYILKFNGESVTIYPNGTSLYYNGATYSKR